jgi:hypothetical protein
MLTLHPYMYFFDGPNLNNNRRAFAFEVIGLPEREQARIAQFRHKWKVLRTTDGVSGEWSGQFRSLDEALASLQ